MAVPPLRVWNGVASSLPRSPCCRRQCVRTFANKLAATSLMPPQACIGRQDGTNALRSGPDWMRRGGGSRAPALHRARVDLECRCRRFAAPGRVVVADRAREAAARSWGCLCGALPTARSDLAVMSKFSDCQKRAIPSCDSSPSAGTASRARARHPNSVDKDSFFILSPC